MKLNLGCGNDYRQGFVNLDDGNCRADVYHDLNVVPYPFEDNQFSYIRAQQVLEHVNRSKWFDIVRELHRISKPNAIWEVMTPYALSDNFFTDPTHSMSFTPRTFDFFDKTKALSELGTIYGIDFELRVLESYLVKNLPNGPDVYFKILVIKDGNGEDIDAVAQSALALTRKGTKKKEGGIIEPLKTVIRKIPILYRGVRKVKWYFGCVMRETKR